MRIIPINGWAIYCCGTDEFQVADAFGGWAPAFTIRNERDAEYARKRATDRPGSCRVVRYANDKIVEATSGEGKKEWKVTLRKPDAPDSPFLVCTFSSPNDAKMFLDAALNSTNVSPEMVD